MPETTAVQDYLKAIYQLGGSSAPVPTNDLAERLGVRPASASGMLRRLDELDFVTYAKYKGTKLTRRVIRASSACVPEPSSASSKRCRSAVASACGSRARKRRWGPREPTPSSWNRSGRRLDRRPDTDSRAHQKRISASRRSPHANRCGC